MPTILLINLSIIQCAIISHLKEAIVNIRNGVDVKNALCTSFCVTEAFLPWANYQHQTSRYMTQIK